MTTELVDPRARSVRDPQVPDPQRIVLRPVGTPLPLAFVGLAVATATLACLDLGWIPATEQHQVALVLIAFAVPLQGLATIFCFLARDAPSGAGIGVQTAAWLTLGLLLSTGAPGTRSDTVSIFLFAAAASLVPAATTTALGKIVPALVMVATTVRFTLTGLYERFGGGAWEHSAGWEGLALACLALYTALAVDLESARHRTVLPLGRHGSGKKALVPGPPRATTLETQPGVREQL